VHIVDIADKQIIVELIRIAVGVGPVIGVVIPVFVVKKRVVLEGYTAPSVVPRRINRRISAPGEAVEKAIFDDPRVVVAGSVIVTITRPIPDQGTLIDGDGGPGPVGASLKKDAIVVGGGGGALQGVPVQGEDGCRVVPIDDEAPGRATVIHRQAIDRHDGPVPILKLQRGAGVARSAVPYPRRNIRGDGDVDPPVKIVAFLDIALEFDDVTRCGHVIGGLNGCL
jgi:hypothetical protein